MNFVDKLSAAKEAINALGTDTSVPPIHNLEALAELAGDIEILMDALREDINNADRS